MTEKQLREVIDRLRLVVIASLENGSSEIAINAMLNRLLILETELKAMTTENQKAYYQRGAKYDRVLTVKVSRETAQALRQLAGDEPLSTYLRELLARHTEQARRV